MARRRFGWRSGPRWSTPLLLLLLGLLGPVWVASSALADGLTAPDARALLAALKSRDVDEAREAVESAGAGKDRRFVAPLIELLRAESIGIVDGLQRRDLVAALEQLSGESFGDDWPAWITWYAGTDLGPPDGFIGWKGQLLSRIDPHFGPLLASGMPAKIRVEEIVWGGVKFEGIVALDSPTMISVDAASYLRPDEPVFGITIKGDARAYPLRILDWHEMANDTVGGVPIALAYCTLCGSGIAYDRRDASGRVFDFGSSGLLLRSNKLMVDRQTHTLWDQLTGRPVVGPLVDGPPLRLRPLPSVVTTWRDWRRRHPDTVVLSRETGHRRRYEPGAAYADYFASSETMFPVRDTPGLPAKARVFGIELGDETRAYSIRNLTRAKVINDRIAGRNVVLVASRAPILVEGRSQRSGLRRRYEVGAEVRAYVVGEERFKRVSREAERDVLIETDGGRWRIEEGALIGPGGQQYMRLAGIQAYWFAWSIHFPETTLYGPTR